MIPVLVGGTGSGSSLSLAQTSQPRAHSLPTLILTHYHDLLSQPQRTSTTKNLNHKEPQPQRTSQVSATCCRFDSWVRVLVELVRRLCDRLCGLGQYPRRRSQTLVGPALRGILFVVLEEVSPPALLEEASPPALLRCAGSIR